MAAEGLVGSMLDGRYQVKGRIARGGMATVYYAIDTRLDRPVALKVMHPGLTDDPEFVGRFIREARSAARLSHPHIVAVFDQGNASGLVYLAMEYVDGRTLRDALREHGPLTPRQAFGVMEPVLAALGAAHQAGLVHRDVKPENVLLADDGRVKVADFGLARAVHNAADHTSSGILIGTVGYLSPEQVDGGAADARSDVYAAGIMLYELLTGEKPYTGETSLQVAYQHVHSVVPPPSAQVRGLSPHVDRLVARATDRQAQLRPSDGTAFLSELVRIHEQLTDAELDAGGVVRPQLHAAAAATAVLNPVAPAALPAAQETAVVPRARPDRLPATRPTGTRRALRRPPPGKSRRRGGLAMTFLLAAALIVSLFAWWLGGGGHTNVPSVVGLSVAEAQALLNDAGLKVQVGDQVFSDEYAAGLVARSDPDPGSRVDRQSGVVLYPSKGPQLFAVPDLTGKSVDEADALLADAHLARGEVTDAFDNRLEAGKIVSTDPQAGEQLRGNQPVALVVSKGPAPVDVPSVVGEPISNAREILSAAGLSVSEQTVHSADVPVDIVIAQDPESGAVPPGTTIALTVSLGPEVSVVPDVVGMKLDRAQRVLTDAGFVPEVFINLPGSQDRVISQFPLADAEAPPGSTVRLSTS